MKYINADQLKDKLKSWCSPINKYELLQLLDELSEEREEYEVSKDIDFIQPFKTKTYKVKPNPLKVAIKGDGYTEISLKEEEKENTRYFFICTAGIAPNGTYSFNNFDYSTNGNYPTMKECINESNKRFLNLRDVMLVSVTEMTSDEYETFISEQ